MSLKTTNNSTIIKAVNLRDRIKRELKEILALIEIDTTESLANVTKKLKFLYKLIERFKEDEEKNLFSSDKIALEFLQGQVLDFIKKFDEKTAVEHLAMAQRLKRTTDTALETA